MGYLNLIFGYFGYMEGTVCDPIIKGETNNKINNNRINDNTLNNNSLSILVSLPSIFINYLSIACPINIVLSIVLFIYFIALLYGIYVFLG